MNMIETSKAASFLSVLVAVSACAASMEPQQLPGGTTTEVTVDSELSEHTGEAGIKILVPAGQGLSVMQLMEGDTNNFLTLTLLDPDGQEVGERDDSCNQNVSIPLTKAGTYTVKAVACAQYEKWSGPFDLQIRVGTLEPQ